MVYVGEIAAGDLDPLRHRAQSRAVRPASQFPEIDCVRHRLSFETCRWAEGRAEALGVGAHEVLLAHGAISAEAYYRALAFSLGLRFCDVDTVSRAACPLDDERLIDAANAGVLPLRRRHGLEFVFTPRGLDARTLAVHVATGARLAPDALITTPERLRLFAERHARRVLAAHAVGALRRRLPAYSAATFSLPGWIAAGGCGALISIVAVLVPLATIWIAQVAFTALFLAWTALRVRAAAIVPPRALRFRRAETALPIYTIIVALHDEAAAAPGLTRALRALDYPPEKLDIKLVLEPDDRATFAALNRLRLPDTWEVLFAPPVGPRTKPKALNSALPFARGAYTVIYDAEDRPEPDQLRRALDAFAAGDEKLACVQARLTIDNTKDGWLAALFTAEYAGQFDVLLPGLVTHDLPIPLGGSSNHFRTQVLKDAGGWDPYNVTEDADLGTRLARLGFRAGMIASSTYEEAPARLTPWLKQRTRWFKGWLQTWCVHMRRPLRLARELGWRGFIVFQLMLVGTVFAALLQPFAWALAVAGLTIEAALPSLDLAIAPALIYVHVAALLSGYATSVVLAFTGLAQRRLLWVAWLLPLVVVHWVLLSVAAWRALYQLLVDPYRWEKTAHGLARTSRRAAAVRRKPGELRDIAADRPRRRPAAA